MGEINKDLDTPTPMLCLSYFYSTDSIDRCVSVLLVSIWEVCVAPGAGRDRYDQRVVRPGQDLAERSTCLVSRRVLPFISPVSVCPTNGRRLLFSIWFSLWYTQWHIPDTFYWRFLLIFMFSNVKFYARYLRNCTETIMAIICTHIFPMSQNFYW